MTEEGRGGWRRSEDWPLEERRERCSGVVRDQRLALLHDILHREPKLRHRLSNGVWGGCGAYGEDTEGISYQIGCTRQGIHV